MLEVTLVVSIWMGAAKNTFTLHPARRFNWDTQCSRAADDIAELIRRRAHSIKKMTRLAITSSCKTAQTRPT